MKATFSRITQVISDTADKTATVVRNGDTVLNGRVAGGAIRVILSSAEIDIGAPSQAPPGVRKTNCTHSVYPCRQVRNISIWVEAKRLFVSRSAFADCADIGTMTISVNGEDIILTLVGGDASEGYTVKITFDTERVKRREVFQSESDSLSDTTTYLTVAALN